ncbi:cupin-like domain-containing protein [Myxococcus sp. K15C18031901]|uniref:cupin-like domain-containing protein n=1 Tax=Myxococcus dinghuensis TaxID=2906761 RepID=UPI0020A76F58|nr:cupin-like domain-containing protein [Myxococcus dinghuensis]MCP3104974.1 cupin-like domain-containing protein [Myxococcus dinghuensis]
MTGAALAPEWRRWVVENLLRGAETEDLVAVLARAGVAPSVANDAVNAELADPCFQGAARAVAMQRKLEGLLDLYGEMHRQTPGHDRVERHDVLAPSVFFERYYFQNRPVVMRGSARPPGAEAWARLGVLIREGRVEDSLWREWVVPPETLVDAGVAPRPWWEDAGAVSALAPVRRNVLLCQVRGRRELRLVPAFALHRVLGASDVPRDVPALEVVLEPGEMVLLPVGWWCSHRSPEGGAGFGFEAFRASGPNVEWAPGSASREPTPPPRGRLE